LKKHFIPDYGFMQFLMGSIPLGIAIGMVVTTYRLPVLHLNKVGSVAVNPLLALITYIASIAFVVVCGKILDSRKQPIREYAVICYGAAICLLMHRYVYHGGLFLFFSGTIILYAYFLLRKGSVFERIEITRKASFIILAILFAGYFFIVGGAAVLKYQFWISDTFDTGIFTQIFYAMSTDFSQVSTVERNMPLSHFAIHVSPFLYLLLPGYMIFKSSVYLILIQVGFMGSCVFPLFLIAKKRGLTNFQALLISLCLILSPIMTNSVMFSFHALELSLPLILWLLYFFEKRYIKSAFIMSAALLMIREDMSIICFCIGIYAWIGLREKRAILVALAALVWFFVCVKIIIPNCGGAPFYDRYSSLMIGESSSVEVIRTIIRNPLYVMHTVLMPEKLLFVMQLMLPVLFLPLIRPRGLVLLIPAVLWHLLSNYKPQYQIFYQYPTTTLVICLYLVAINSTFLKRRGICSSVLTVCVLLTILCRMAYVSKYLAFYPLYLNNREMFQKIDAISEKIPDDQSVSTSLLFGAKLANRKNLRIFPDTTDCKYIFLDLRPGLVPPNNLKRFIDNIVKKSREGYKVINYRRGTFLLMIKGKGHPVTKKLLQDIIKTYSTRTRRKNTANPPR
jgi:uncharacterized membrane protein